MKKRRIINVASFLGIVLTIICIGYLSHQSSNISYKITGSVVSEVIKKPVTQSEWNQYSSYMPIARKLAHVFLYSILGFFCSAYFSDLIYKKSYSKSCVLICSVLFCFIYGIMDEIHQSFIPGRGVSIYDVLIDSIGGFIGVLIYFVAIKSLYCLFMIIHKYNRRKK